MFRKRKNEKGFTLVEVAIVMVIIGLLIGGVLKGMEMIKDAKVKRIMADADAIRAAVASYQDRFRQLPGDDSLATSHGGTTNGNGNGQIAGTALTAAMLAPQTPATESGYLFQDLRANGLFAGNANDLPVNAFGGVYQVIWVAVAGTTTHWVQFSNILSDAAQIVDARYDDGVWNTGAIRTNAAYPAVGAAPIQMILYIQF